MACDSSTGIYVGLAGGHVYLFVCLYERLRACALFRDSSVDPREKVPFYAKFPVLEKDFDFLGTAHDPVYEVRLDGTRVGVGSL
jgi:hypothetical protein